MVVMNVINSLHPLRRQWWSLSIYQLLRLIFVSILPAQIMGIHCEPPIGFAYNRYSFRVLDVPLIDMLLIDLKKIRVRKLVWIPFLLFFKLWNIHQSLMLVRNLPILLSPCPVYIGLVLSLHVLILILSHTVVRRVNDRVRSLGLRRSHF